MWPNNLVKTLPRNESPEKISVKQAAIYRWRACACKEVKASDETWFGGVRRWQLHLLHRGSVEPASRAGPSIRSRRKLQLRRRLDARDRLGACQRGGRCILRSASCRFPKRTGCQLVGTAILAGFNLLPHPRPAL